MEDLTKTEIDLIKQNKLCVNCEHSHQISLPQSEILVCLVDHEKTDVCLEIINKNVTCPDWSKNAGKTSR